MKEISKEGNVEMAVRMAIKKVMLTTGSSTLVTIDSVAHTLVGGYYDERRN